MTEDTTRTHAASPLPLPPLLRDLGLLIGQWEVDLVFPTDPPGRIHAQAVFNWLEGQAFVIEQFGGSTWIIGGDDTTDTYSVLYHDERGVVRVYQMSLHAGLWKLWRTTVCVNHIETTSTGVTGASIRAPCWNHALRMARLFCAHPSGAAD